MNRARLQRLTEVTLLLVQRDFRGRYKHTRVGMLWAIANPLMFLLIFYFVFKIVLHIGIPHYASFVFTGILAWTWFQSSLVQAASSISSNPGLVTQPGFPVAALPVVATCVQLMNLALAVPILIAILALEGSAPSAALIALPLVVAVQFMLTLGTAYLLAALNVAFRDVEHILPIVLQLGYYVTPIFYDVGRIDPSYRWVFALNPMFHIVDAYRSILLAGQFPDIAALLVLGALASLLLWIGASYFDRARLRFLEDI